MQTSTGRARFRRRLLNWFDRSQRDLPWRKNRSRYRIWVSEIMLQQTQVVTVIEYFNRFIKTFPNIQSLAMARESQVLKMWEGLGYYRRARQMHAAARKITDDHQGIFPDTFEEVLALPGIGRYTANAILSIADDQPLPVLEGNTIRVYSRLMNFSDDVMKSSSQKQLWAFAESLVSRHRPGDLNQALMELGSEICKTGSPDCLKCPVSRHCLAFQTGGPEKLPWKGGRRIEYQSIHHAAVVIRRGHRVVVRLCGPDEHWTGLWDFPRYSVGSGNVGKEITGFTRSETGLTIQVGNPVARIRHTVTRYRITLDCYEAEKVSGRLRSCNQLRWVTINELNNLAMSVTGRKIARRLDGK